MATTVLTTACLGQRDLGGGCLMAYGSLAFDGGDYVTGGVLSATPLRTFDHVMNRNPDFVYCISTNGWRYNWDPSTFYWQIRNTGLGGDTPHPEYTNLTAVVAGAANGGFWIAFWFGGMGR